MSLGGDQSANEKLLREAVERGINYFDTADLYQKGENEVTVGKAFRGIRDNVIIATKVGNQMRDDGSGWDWNPTKAYILSAVDESLRRLQTDYIDIYQLHGGTIDDPIDETIEAFELLRQQGKIRHYGISSIRPNVIREYVKRSDIVSVMIQYSLLDRRPEEACLQLLQQHSIGVLVRGSLASGMLVNKPATDYLGYPQADVTKISEALRSIKGLDPAQAALRFALSPPSVSSAVVGIRNHVHLETALSIIRRQLTQHQLDMLGSTLTPNQYESHR